MKYDDPIEIETGARPSASIIWLHGLGADGNDFVPIVPELGFGSGPAVRFVFPHAPFRPVTINGGMTMRAWYDMKPAPQGFTETPDHIKESSSYLCTLVEQEQRRGIPAASIVIAGFSQGGAVALQAGLEMPAPVAGIMALSTYLPATADAASSTDRPKAFPPVFMGHGRYDPLIPMARAQASCALLRERGVNVVWREYSMAHSVCREEIADIAQWLRERLA